MKNKHKVYLYKSKYNITNDDLARIFDYSSTQSFLNSSASHRIRRATDKLLELLEDSIIDRIRNR